MLPRDLSGAPPQEEGGGGGVVVPGAEDLWSYDLLECGGRVHITRARTLLYYMASAGTKAIYCHSVAESLKQLCMRVYGPVCEDGVALYVELTVSSGSGGRRAQMNHLDRLSDAEFTLFGQLCERYVVKNHELFPHAAQCDFNCVKRCLALDRPWRRHM